MPLFECENCHVVENTAVSNFWQTQYENSKLPKHRRKPYLCSLCDPDIQQWHGKFERKPASELRSVDPKSFIDK